MANRAILQSEQPSPIGEDFAPLRVLWEGESPTYPSEQSARWAVRQMQGRLAEAGALALHRGSLFVHRQKLAEVAREHAIQAASRRYAPKA
jgi:hypothetical protein